MEKTDVTRIYNFVSLDYNISLDQVNALVAILTVYSAHQWPAVEERAEICTRATAAIIVAIAGEDKALKGRLARAFKYIGEELTKAENDHEV